MDASLEHLDIDLFNSVEDAVQAVQTWVALAKDGTPADQWPEETIERLKCYMDEPCVKTAVTITYAKYFPKNLADSFLYFIATKHFEIGNSYIVMSNKKLSGELIAYVYKNVVKLNKYDFTMMNPYGTAEAKVYDFTKTNRFVNAEAKVPHFWLQEIAMHEATPPEVLHDIIYNYPNAAANAAKNPTLCSGTISDVVAGEPIYKPGTEQGESNPQAWEAAHVYTWETLLEALAEHPNTDTPSLINMAYSADTNTSLKARERLNETKLDSEYSNWDIYSDSTQWNGGPAIKTKFGYADLNHSSAGAVSTISNPIQRAGFDCAWWEIVEAASAPQEVRRIMDFIAEAFNAPGGTSGASNHDYTIRHLHAVAKKEDLFWAIVLHLDSRVGVQFWENFTAVRDVSNDDEALLVKLVTLCSKTTGQHPHILSSLFEVLPVLNGLSDTQLEAVMAVVNEQDVDNIIKVASAAKRSLLAP